MASILTLTCGGGENIENVTNIIWRDLPTGFLPAGQLLLFLLQCFDGEGNNPSTDCYLVH